jgi:hypothetical protein
MDHRMYTSANGYPDVLCVGKSVHTESVLHPV